MRRLRKIGMTTALLLVALLPMIASGSPDPAVPNREGTLPVAIAQPLAAIDGAPLVAVPRQDGSTPTLPESGMLVLVGTGLLGLAAIVRRST